MIFDGGGGIGDLRKKVEDQVSAHPYRSVRYWALFDSDAPAPGIRSTEATLAANACVKSGIKHHVLDRRAIENYLPKGALYDWVSETPRKAAERRKKADAFYRLSPDQRAHFHVKSGFTKPPCEHERSLFKEVSELDRATLASGVGKKVAELYGTMDPRRLRSFVEKEGSDKELRPAIAELIEMLRVPNG
ncbi:hypothetical protein [Brevundimonas naejangsanensis]|uniref:hypothetical protein n=1 Tax=Brevundimonas naejangsanensis TaxID=588932 RepID=UPI003D03BA6E